MLRNARGREKWPPLMSALPGIWWQSAPEAALRNRIKPDKAKYNVHTRRHRRRFASKRERQAGMAIIIDNARSCESMCHQSTNGMSAASCNQGACAVIIRSAHRWRILPASRPLLSRYAVFGSSHRVLAMSSAINQRRVKAIKEFYNGIFGPETATRHHLGGRPCVVHAFLALPSSWRGGSAQR